MVPRRSLSDLGSSGELMIIRDPLCLPSLKPAGNITIGKSVLPCSVLDWTGFPAELGPDGCANVRFALGKDIANKLRELSLAAELSFPNDLGRWAAGYCIVATAGCVAALSKLLADSAVSPKTQAWMTREEKEELSRWISRRIWRMSNQRAGHDPESLASIGFEAERVPQMLTILSETFEKEPSSPPYEYRAVVAKGGKMYRVHLCLEGAGPRDFFSVRRMREDGSEEIGNASMDRTKDGKIIVLVMGDVFPPGSRDKILPLSEDKDDLEEFEVEYDQADAFLADWVLNGLEQSPGMVEEVGEVPGLFPKPTTFKYSSGFPRSNPTVKDEDDDGLYRSVAIFPAPKDLKNLIGGEAAIIEEGDIFVDRSDGQWFRVDSIHDHGGPNFHLSSTTPEASQCQEAGRYPPTYEGESTEDDVNLDELLSGYVCMSDVDSAAKGCELVVTKTVKGKTCISVQLAKGPKVMCFELGDEVVGQSEIVDLKDDRVVFQDGRAELYEDLINRVCYWDKIEDPGITVSPEEQEGPSEELLEGCLKTIEESVPYQKPAHGMVGVKVGDLAREFGVPGKVVIEIAKAYNIDVRNASTILKPGQADRLRAKLGVQKKGK